MFASRNKNKQIGKTKIENIFSHQTFDGHKNWRKCSILLLLFCFLFSPLFNLFMRERPSISNKLKRTSQFRDRLKFVCAEKEREREPLNCYWRLSANRNLLPTNYVLLLHTTNSKAKRKKSVINSWIHDTLLRLSTSTNLIFYLF